ncbi:MAG: CPXCG motif-containing cysteine-rich protein [Gammaproteobacteria bacterium]|nr:CPXCG motif-containing cysteine-rich protein [Gammaproteobacteria bacterium]
MKRRSSPELARLRRRLGRLDAASIDRLYGLEPVWEPGTGRALAPEEFVPIRCPYCGERWATRVDLTAEEPAYVEDCHVCCRPIEMHIEREDGGALRAVRVQRLD